MGRTGGKPTALLGPYGHRTLLAADANDWLSEITSPAGRHHEFRYTEHGLLEIHIDPRGSTSKYEYLETGHLKRAINRAGTTKEFTRIGLEEDYRVVQTSPTGLATEYHVNHRASGAVNRTRTDRAGFPTFTYDLPDGRREIVYPDGTVSTSQLSGDPRFGMTSAITSGAVITTPGGRTRTVSHSRSVTLSDPLDPLSVVSMVDTFVDNGKTATHTWDAATKTYTLVSPESRISIFKVDDLQRPVETELPGFLPVFSSYDSNGRLEWIRQGTGTSLRQLDFHYDAMGRLQSLTDPIARVSTFTYDDDDFLASQLLPENQTVALNYDGNGSLEDLTPPGRPAHAFEYTPDNLPELYRPPTLGGGLEASSIEYDDDRRPDLLTRAGGVEVDIEYDTKGRLRIVRSGADLLTYNYSPSTGQLDSVVGPNSGQTTAYGFDGFLPTSTTWSGQVVGSVIHTFDDDFRLATETINGSSSILYEHDDDDLIEQAGALDVHRVPSTGFLDGTTLGVVTTDEMYSLFGEFSLSTASSNGTEILRISVPERDKLGRIVETSETIGGVTDTYRYDYEPSGRLRSVIKNGVAFSSYSYDANGNRTSYSGPFGSISSPVYDDQDRLTAYGSNTYSYRRSGELASKTTNGQTIQYGYDDFGSLRTVDLPDGVSIEYVVDGQGRRVGKKVQGSLVQGFLYRDDLNPVAELDGTGNIVSRFVYGTRSWVPDYFIKAGTTYRIISDLRGSVRLVVDAASGTIVQRLDYDEFGRILQDSNPGFQPFGYAGVLYDPQTGLIRFGARDYDPEIGRWTAKDPILFAGSRSNLYAYVLSEPINRIDPEGLFDFSDVLVAMPNIPQGVSDFSAGFGNAMLWGFGDELRNTVNDQLDIDSSVDPCSSLYTAGEIAGAATELALGAGAAKSAFSAGKEIKLGKNLRLAPFGNRTGHRYGRYPHYHRRGFNPDGSIREGQGMKRHRPWEPWSNDTSFSDRF